LGPVGTAATNRPIVPAPGGYDDEGIGGMIGKGNRSTRRKPVPVPLCPPQTSPICPNANPGRRGGKPATNHLSYGTALVVIVYRLRSSYFVNFRLKFRTFRRKQLLSFFTLKTEVVGSSKRCNHLLDHKVF
jgi:hypothetical protein